MPGPTRASLRHLVRLRDVQPSDLPILFEHQLDPESNRMAVANPRARAAFDAFWAKVLGDRSVIAKAIVLDAPPQDRTAGRSEERVVGNISCFKLDGLDSVGYWIAREHWGRGIATRALELLLVEVAIRPLHARIARTNAGSLRVLERCGFIVTGYHMSPGNDRFPACEEALLVLR